MSSVSSVSSCGQTPIRARIAGPSVAGSIPRIRRSPPLIGETAATIRMVEDLPAPLGPRKPNASPLRTSTSIPFTASKSPNDLRRSRARIMGSMSATREP